jgi:hypothetical protein
MIAASRLIAYRASFKTEATDEPAVPSRASETLAITKRQSDPITKRIQKIVFSLIVLVAYPKALNLIH